MRKVLEYMSALFGLSSAGFEIGSGIRINSSLPEDDAAVLRGE
jgi:hypothetical protein